jgi:hypothetical protein
MKKHAAIIPALTILSMLLGSGAHAATPASFSGKILIQTQSRGQAWYVNPVTLKRNFLYKPAQAFQIMRERGIGISNADLSRIPIGFYAMTGADGDGDGLVNIFEQAIGTSIGDTDSDDDGFSDREEVRGGFNPNGPGKVRGLNSVFAAKQRGKIFLQTQSRGEAWYVNPSDAKRYYLGTGEDALTLMRTFGIGVSDANLARIPVSSERMGCGNDMPCFIAASESAQPATVDWTYRLPWGTGYDYLYTTRMATGASNGALKSTFESNIVGIRIYLTDEYRQSLRDQGKTEADITEFETEQNATLVGTPSNFWGKSCTYPTIDRSKLTALLRNWANLAFSTTDMAFMQCVTTTSTPDTELPDESNNEAVSKIPTSTEPSGITDCLENFDCFIEASEAGRRPVLVTWINELPFGLIFKTSTKMGLGQEAPNKLRFRQQLISINVYANDEMKAQARAAGKTDEEIHASEVAANAAAQTSVGSGQNCVFAESDAALMTAVLRRWKEGKFSSNDFAFAECKTFEADTDADGLNATDETNSGTDPNNADTDGDGIADGDEKKLFYPRSETADPLNPDKTDPLNPDSDGDGFKDGDEIAAGFDPTI